MPVGGQWQWEMEMKMEMGMAELATQKPNCNDESGLCALQLCLAATGDPDHKPGASSVQLSGSWINRT